MGVGERLEGERGRCRVSGKVAGAGVGIGVDAGLRRVLSGGGCGVESEVVIGGLQGSDLWDL